MLHLQDFSLSLPSEQIERAQLDVHKENHLFFAKKIEKQAGGMVSPSPVFISLSIVQALCKLSNLFAEEWRELHIALQI